MSTSFAQNRGKPPYNCRKTHNYPQMQIFSTHENSDFLRLAEENRPETTDFVSDLTNNSVFRVNVNHEVIEQILNGDNTFNWMEELGFYRSDNFLISRSIALIDDLAIQFRIPINANWDSFQITDVITSGKHFENLKCEVTYADRYVISGDFYYKLTFLTANENQNV